MVEYKCCGSKTISLMYFILHILRKNMGQTQKGRKERVFFVNIMMRNVVNSLGWEDKMKCKYEIIFPTIMFKKCQVVDILGFCGYYCNLL